MRKKISSLFATITSSELYFLLASLILFLLLRLPSLIEPDWYGDEGIYQVIGMSLNDGRLLYRDIWDNKPPLLYLLYALVNGDHFSARLLSLLFGGASIIAFFLLVKRLFVLRWAVVISTFFFTLLFATPYIEGNIANAENFMLLPILIAFYFIFPPLRFIALRYYALGGVLLSAAFLIKIVGLFDFAALFFILSACKTIQLLEQKKKIFDYKLLRNKFLPEAVLLLSFLVPILVTALYFLVVGAFGDFARAVFLQNVGYVGYGNKAGFPMGLLLIKTSVLFLVSVIFSLLYFRKKISILEFGIYIYTAFSLYNAFFSQRPYTHYVLVLLPAWCLMVGLFLNQGKNKLFTGMLLLGTTFLVFSTFTPSKRVVQYYQNFLSFVTGQKSVKDYRAFFDRISPRDYTLAEFIKLKTTPSENIFLWSDSGQIYALSNKLPPGRYIVSYHMTFYKGAVVETQEAIAKANPKYIIATKEGSILSDFTKNYTLFYTIEGAKIFSRINE